MSGKLSESLALRLKDTPTIEASTPVPVIVTLREGVNASTLERLGFDLKRLSETAGLVSMSLTPAEIERLATVDAVRLIEEDGPFWALQGQ